MNQLAFGLAVLACAMLVIMPAAADDYTLEDFENPDDGGDARRWFRDGGDDAPDRPLCGEPIADVPYEPSSIDAVSFCRGDSINDIYT